MGKSKGFNGRQQLGAKQRPVALPGGFSNREIETSVAKTLFGMSHTPAYPHYEKQRAEAERIAEISHGRLSERRERAFLIPTVNLILGATLTTLNLSKVKARLAATKEMADRARVAQTCTELVVQCLMRGEIDEIANQYVSDRERLGLLGDINDREHNKQLERLLDKHSLILEDENKLVNLAAVNFHDAALVAGGAVKVLRNRGVNKKIGAIIGHSHSLQLVASLEDEVKAAEIHPYLGRPYANSKHFIYSTGDDRNPEQLAYTDETAAYLRSFYRHGAGCPARQVSLPGSPHKTLLRKGWAEVVDFLVPDYVTVDSTQPIHAPKVAPVSPLLKAATGGVIPPA